jgi:hypothetical protein
LAQRIQETRTEHLLVMLEFFDSPRLRQFYTGLIADIRAELLARGMKP